MTDKKFCICLIDDDIYVRDALALGLKEAGYEVNTAPGAVAGLDLIRRGAVDAIITDMNMPGTGGAALISQARAAWPNMPIIAITGVREVEGRDVVEIAYERGASAVLAKPFRIFEMAALLGRLLNASTV